MTPTINPALCPLMEAPHGVPIMLYSAHASPMWVQALGASVELGWMVDGNTPGVWTARYGFFPHFKMPENDFEWTHYAEVVPLHVEE